MFFFLNGTGKHTNNAQSNGKNEENQYHHVLMMRVEMTMMIEMMMLVEMMMMRYRCPCRASILADGIAPR